MIWWTPPTFSRNFSPHLGKAGVDIRIGKSYSAMPCSASAPSRRSLITLSLAERSLPQREREWRKGTEKASAVQRRWSDRRPGLNDCIFTSWIETRSPMLLRPAQRWHR